MNMIDEKKISETASFFAKETWNHEEEQFACMDGFRVGVGWAQQEFIKSLWHDVSDEPKDGAISVLMGEEGNAITYVIDSDYSSWKEVVETLDITKWCYLSDILPKEGGEKRNQ